MEIDLTGNVKTLGSVFLTASVSEHYDRRLVQRLVTVETDGEGRRGKGWGLLIAPRVVVGIGTWRVEDDEVTSEAREAREVAHQIPGWHTVFQITTEEKRSGLPDGWSFVPYEEAP